MFLSVWHIHYKLQELFFSDQHILRSFMSIFVDFYLDLSLTKKYETVTDSERVTQHYSSDVSMKHNLIYI